MTARIAQRLIAAGGVLCLVGALSLGVHAQAATSSSDDADLLEWSASLDCTATCHSSQAEAMADETTQGAQAHGAFSCVSCHTDEEGLIEGHAKVTTDETKSPKRLKKSEVTADGCLTCHQVTDGVVPADAWAIQEDGDDAELTTETEASQEEATEEEDAATAALAIPAYSAEATADIDYLVDANGTMVNPHDLPVNKSHATITCATCHAMHDDTTLEETAVKACIKCHHDNVYECFTCHD